jgi:hypothetical protein
VRGHDGAEGVDDGLEAAVAPVLGHANKLQSSDVTVFTR